MTGTGLRYAQTAVKYLGLTLLLYPLGVVCHELVGHGFVGIACGGRIARVEILTLRVWPDFHFIGWAGHYGECEVVGVPTPTGEALVSLGGAVSTFCVAMIAVVLLWIREWGRIARPILITLSLWWLDLLTYTLPSWGLRRSVFWGQRTFSEPYEAAVTLGMPGPLFQMLVVVGCSAVLAAMVIRLCQVKNRGEPQANGTSSN